MSDVSPFSRKIVHVNFISPRIRNSKCKVLSSGYGSPTLSCHRQLNLYPKFLHISHRDNGFFEVLSLHNFGPVNDRVFHNHHCDGHEISHVHCVLASCSFFSLQSSTPAHSEAVTHPLHHALTNPLVRVRVIERHNAAVVQILVNVSEALHDAL